MGALKKMKVLGPEVRLVPEPMVAPDPIPPDFPRLPPANTNVEIVETVASKWLRLGGRFLSKALFYAQFLEFGGDSSPPELRPPIVDTPPAGKNLPAWLDEMREMTEIARLIHQKQNELLLYQHNDQRHLALHVGEELDQLQIQLQAATKVYPILGNFLRATASSGEAAALPTVSSMDPVTFEAYLEGDYLRYLRGIPGVQRVEVDSDLGVIVIHNDRDFLEEPGRIHPLYAEFRVSQVLTDVFPDITGESIESDQRRGVIRLPRPNRIWQMLQDEFPKRLPQVKYATTDVDRDAIHRAHAENTVVIGLHVPPKVYFEDLKGNVHPWLFMLHDWYHAACFTIHSLTTRGWVVRVYDVIAEAAARHGNTVLTDRMLNTLVDLEYPRLESDDLVMRLFMPLQGALRKPPPEDHRRVHQFQVAMDIYEKLKVLRFEGEYAVEQRRVLDRAVRGWLHPY